MNTASNTTRTPKQRLAINAEISKRILAYVVNGGMSVQWAINKVLGPAQYECLVEELYHELRGEAVA